MISRIKAEIINRHRDYRSHTKKNNLIREYGHRQAEPAWLIGATLTESPLKYVTPYDVMHMQSVHQRAIGLLAAGYYASLMETHTPLKEIRSKLSPGDITMFRFMAASMTDNSDDILEVDKHFFLLCIALGISVEIAVRQLRMQKTISIFEGFDWYVTNGSIAVYMDDVVDFVYNSYHGDPDDENFRLAAAETIAIATKLLDLAAKSIKPKSKVIVHDR